MSQIVAETNAARFSYEVIGRLMCVQTSSMLVATFSFAHCLLSRETELIW